MAAPTNPLDFYKSYTYHFELHAARTWDELEALTSDASDESTTPYEANGTLLINTRFDAHQTIDNVRYSYHQPRVDPTGTTAAVADLTMTITEPNGTFFIQKLEKMLEDMEITDINRSCVFLLKVIFVGRKSDNSVDVDELSPICIPLQLIDINAEFTYKGGTYGLVFSGAGAGTIVNNYRKLNHISATDGYSHKNIALRARTVREALEQLEIALQKNYDEVYETAGAGIQGRPIRYEIILDNEIGGDLNLVTKETWAPDDYMKLTFQPEIPIIEIIKRIVMSSKEVNDMISDSADGLRKEFHPNVRYPTYSMRYLLTDNEAIITYHVRLYTGRDSESKADFEFDFLFAEPPGKNVDVISFEMKYASLLGWLQWSLNNSVSWHTHQDNEIATKYPSQYRDNIVRPNVTSERYVDQTPSNVEYTIDNRPMDVKANPGANVRENAGHVQLTHEGAQAARLAFNTVAEMHGSRDPQLTFIIRGHYDLLFPCIPSPDGRDQGFGETDSIWIKVNIKNQDGEDFFYTGYYLLLTVENIFEHGQFIQQLTVVMVDRIRGLTSAQQSTTIPQSNNAQPSGQDTRGESNSNITLTTPGFNTDQLGNVIQ